MEIVQLKRPAGIPLGDDHYLRSICDGVCVLTDKRILLVGALAAKKFTLASVAQIRRFADGILFTRSSGKSVFLKMRATALECNEWALLAENVITREPVLALAPSSRFVPDARLQREAPTFAQSASPRSDEPRYTFRVVGDHIGNRGNYIDRLSLGVRVVLRREPSNPYDRNAVAVWDAHGNQLGYLKRDVAAWFAGILDSGRAYSTIAFRKPSNGGLIVGVYEVK
jgi:hypothetical protein